MWENSNGRWTKVQELGTSGGGVRIEGGVLVRLSDVGRELQTWTLAGDRWTLDQSQAIQSGTLEAFSSGAVLVESKTDNKLDLGYGTLYVQDAGGSWTAIYQDERLYYAGSNSDPVISKTWILGRAQRYWRATYERTPSGPTTQAPTTSTTSPSSSSTTAPPVTSTTNPSGPPPSGGVPCSGLNTLDAQGSFVPKAYWSVLPQYLDGTDAVGEVVKYRGV